MSFANVADPEGHVVGLAPGWQRGNELYWQRHAPGEYTAFALLAAVKCR
jgi:hypothetical protein